MVLYMQPARRVQILSELLHLHSLVSSLPVYMVEDTDTVDALTVTVVVGTVADIFCQVCSYIRIHIIL